MDTGIRKIKKEFGLTDRQFEIWRFMYSYLVKHSYMPTITEVQVAMGMKSPNGVASHLKTLERKGALTVCPNRARAVQLSGIPTYGELLKAKRCSCKG